MRAHAGLILVLVACGAAVATGAEGDARTVTTEGKAVLVELFTSQGCNYCPTAEKVIAELPRRGYGPDRVIPLAFHVDYFNTPWADPFSHKAFSGREWAYDRVAKAADPKAESLYFTPMIMVDGRYPMSGYNGAGPDPVWPFLKERVDRALSEPAPATIVLTIAGAPGLPTQRSVTVRARPTSDRLVGRPVWVGLAVAEGPLTTAVPSGENAGATLVEDHVVRRYLGQQATLARDAPAEATFTIEPGPGWDPARTSVVAILQDETTGAVYQAATIPWSAPAAPAAAGRR